MCRYIFIFITITILNPKALSQDSQVWMFGPMLHLNIGDKKVRTSFALELSYWDYEHFPYSFDWGIEMEKKKVRFYTEAQTGIGIAGISSGPVLEIHVGEGLKAGMQGSFWINYILGVDVRFRKTGGVSYICPGTYFKIPLGYDGDTGDDDWDWDWDD